MMRPSVTLKLATSLDGRIATASGESRWITGALARAAGHKLRAAHDAIAVGVGTALADDPQLTARTEPPVERQPVRVIFDRRLRVPPAARLFCTSGGPVILVAGEGRAQERRSALVEAGAEILDCPCDEAGLDLAAALMLLAGRGVASIYVEGGGQIAASLVRAGLVDRLEWFRAPLLLGGDGISAIAPLGLTRLDDAPGFRRESVRALGPDLHESYQRI